MDNATLKWVKTFDMESRILSQLIELKRTAMELTTATITGPESKPPFSGFSIVIAMVMKDIPDSLPRTGASSLLYRLLRVVHHSVMLLNAISLTISHGFLGEPPLHHPHDSFCDRTRFSWLMLGFFYIAVGRCRNVGWALSHLGVHVVSLVDRQVGREGVAGPRWPSLPLPST